MKWVSNYLLQYSQDVVNTNPWFALEFSKVGTADKKTVTILILYGTM